MNQTNAFRREIEILSPAVFALVMSTGIISIASHLLQFEKVSHILFLVNKIQFAVLLVMLVARLFMFFPAVAKDLSSHAKGAGFLSIVAASSIVGVQFVLLDQQVAPALFLWFFALLAWMIIMYSFFISVIIKKEKPSLEKGINGSWLLVVVSTQSLSILACTLQKQLPFSQDIIAFFSLAAFLTGFILYIILITIIFQRLIFSPLTPEEFAPSYWIDMGACAITTLAAATFISTNKTNPFFADLIPFLKTSGVLCWAVSTWWIPIIFILEIWQHVSQKYPLKYNVGYWSMVFPLGMYTVCTYKIADALNFSFLQSISSAFIYIAWSAWLITFIAMCWHVAKIAISKC